MSIARLAAINSQRTDFDALWDVSDVARYLKVSRSWVYQRAEAGLLPYLRVGGLLRFSPPSIRAFALGETTPIPSRGDSAAGR